MQTDRQTCIQICVQGCVTLLTRRALVTPELGASTDRSALLVLAAGSAEKVLVSFNPKGGQDISKTQTNRRTQLHLSAPCSLGLRGHRGWGM